MLQDFRLFFFLALLIIVYKKKNARSEWKEKSFLCLHPHRGLGNGIEGKKEAEVEDGNEKS